MIHGASPGLQLRGTLENTSAGLAAVAALVNAVAIARLVAMAAKVNGVAERRLFRFSIFFVTVSGLRFSSRCKLLNSPGRPRIQSASSRSMSSSDLSIHVPRASLSARLMASRFSVGTFDCTLCVELKTKPPSGAKISMRSRKSESRRLYAKQGVGRCALRSGSGSPDLARGQTPLLEHLAGRVSLFPATRCVPGYWSFLQRQPAGAGCNRRLSGQAAQPARQRSAGTAAPS